MAASESRVSILVPTGATALESGDLEAFASAMTAAYGAHDDVRTWWLDRAALAAR